jgi:hypothetical protein
MPCVKSCCDSEKFAEGSAEEVRLRWWDADARTSQQIADIRGMTTVDGEDYPPLPDIPVDEKYLGFVYTEDIPVLYGHYWFDWGNHQEDWTDYTACVDFGGKLVAYRWDGGAHDHLAPLRAAHPRHTGRNTLELSDLHAEQKWGATVERSLTRLEVRPNGTHPASASGQC